MEMSLCSKMSQAASESLLGTAPEAEVWFLLEYDRSWAPKAFEASELSVEVRQHIESWLESMPRSRFQFIKRADRSEKQGLALHVAISSDKGPRLSEWHLSQYEELLDLKIEAMLEDSSAVLPPGRLLFLVCTHGKRDRCCALQGLPMFQALHELESGSVWQTTHLGGHRFAANVAVLPHGYVYGRLQPAEALELVRSHRQQNVYRLERLRGRSCYDGPAQTAEVFLRAKAATLSCGALSYARTERRDENMWDVFFKRAEGPIDSARIVREMTGRERPASCGASAEPVYAYRAQALP